MVATTPSTASALWLVHAEGLPASIAVASALCGSLGGLLPDVDARDSVPTRLVFAGLGVISAFLVANFVTGRLAAQDQWALTSLAGLLTYFAVRHGLARFFGRVTTHRGLIHSIPVAVASGLALEHTTRIVFPELGVLSLWPGLFLTGGFLIHLVLDEVYSVDLRGIKLKRSFGTALKFTCKAAPIRTLLVYLAIFLMGSQLPFNRVASIFSF